MGGYSNQVVQRQQYPMPSIHLGRCFSLHLSDKSGKWKKKCKEIVTEQEKQVRKNRDIRAFFCAIKIHVQTETVTYTNYETIEID